MSANAIETRYSGYRMRSRLEARWAVVFDALGLDWEYEPEGFELSCGRYLPDFYIRDWDLYAEVKPDVPRSADTRKVLCFATEKHAVLTLVGTPGTDDYGCVLLCTAATTVTVAIKFCRVDGVPMLWRASGTEALFSDPARSKRIDCLVSFGECERELECGRAARFEFGESGARS